MSVARVRGRGQGTTWVASLASLLTAVLLGVSTTAAGQTARGPRPPASVRLLVRPRVGDTLRLEVEQTVELRSRRGAAAAPGLATAGARPPQERRPDFGPRADRATVRVTKVALFAHSVVESSDLTATSLRATTDSMAMGSGGSADEAILRPVPMSADAPPVLVQVTTDGAMRVLDPPSGAMALGATLASLPGLLPDAPVAVGTSWTREMSLPSLPLGGFRVDGVVRARLRLDSLTHGGRDAWISLEGVLRRDGAARELPAGTRLITAGTMRGSMVVDRSRAWIVDARTVMDVQSEVVAGPASSVPAMMLEIRIGQRVRVR
jgi:hypothetical protein